MTKDLSEHLSEDGHHNFIDFLKKIRNSPDVFELLDFEYQRLCTDSNIQENFLYLLPLIVTEINYADQRDFVKEITLKMHSQEITFFVKYNYDEDSLKIYYKIRSSSSPKNTKLLTLLTLIAISEYEKFNQVSIKSCNLDNNTIKYNIFQLENLRQKINESFINIKPIKLKIRLKVYQTHSEIVNYILKYYDKFYQLESISKISKQTISSILKSNIGKENSDELFAKSLLIWCKFHLF